MASSHSPDKKVEGDGEGDGEADDEEKKDEEQKESEEDEDNYMEMYVQDQLKEKLEPVDEKIEELRGLIERLEEKAKDQVAMFSKYDYHYSMILKTMLQRMGVNVSNLDGQKVLREFQRLKEKESLSMLKIKSRELPKLEVKKAS